MHRPIEASVADLKSGYDRLAAGPVHLAQDFSAIHHNPDDTIYVEGSGLLKIKENTFLAIVPVVPRGVCNAKERRSKESMTYIYRSDDNGQTWRLISQLPYYSAVPWQVPGRDAVYLFTFKGGTTHRNDDMLLLRSDDGGRSWSQPETLFEGHFWNCHTNMVFRDGRLYWAFDQLKTDASVGRQSCVLVGDLSGNLMDKASWRISNAVPFPGVPPQFTQPHLAATFPGYTYLEPNVIDVLGQLRMLAVVKVHGQSTPGFAAVFNIHDDGNEVKLEFAQYHPMPFGQLKFFTAWDEASGLFWAAGNMVVDSQAIHPWWDNAKLFGFRAGKRGGNDRRFLMLYYSLDGLNWFTAGCIAQARKIGQSFMYPAIVIDGEDMAIISRTCINAPDQHDADHATFHRVRDFRKLAMNLIPEE